MNTCKTKQGPLVSIHKDIGYEMILQRKITDYGVAGARVQSSTHCAYIIFKAHFSGSAIKYVHVYTYKNLKFDDTLISKESLLQEIIKRVQRLRPEVLSDTWRS